MNSEELFDSFRARILGRPVRFRRLAANSLLVYFDSEPGENTGVTVWLEPTWHLRSPKGVLTGSRQAQLNPEGEEDTVAGFQSVSAACDTLLGRVATEMRFDPVSGDLELEFVDSYSLRTFVSDPTDDHIWHIRDNVSGATLRRGGVGFE